jgi:hypothetical protein
MREISGCSRFAMAAWQAGFASPLALHVCSVPVLVTDRVPGRRLSRCWNLPSRLRYPTVNSMPSTCRIRWSSRLPRCSPNRMAPQRS